jgi:hypothetical protein
MSHFTEEDFKLKKIYTTDHATPFTTADAHRDSFKLDIVDMTQRYKYAKNPCRVFGGGNIKLLTIQRNEILWGYDENFKKKSFLEKQDLSYGSLNGLKIKASEDEEDNLYDDGLEFTTSDDLENAIRYKAVNFQQHDILENEDKDALLNDGPYYFEEDTKGTTYGTINTKNTAHAGTEILYEQEPNLTKNNFDETHISILKLGQQDLQVGDILEPYVPFWDTKKGVHGNSVWDPTKNGGDAYWHVYKHTLPVKMQTSRKLCIRYRKVKEFMFKAEVLELLRQVLTGEKTFSGLSTVDRKKIKKYIEMCQKKIKKQHGFFMQCMKAAKFGQDATFFIYRK